MRRVELFSQFEFFSVRSLSRSCSPDHTSLDGRQREKKQHTAFRKRLEGVATGGAAVTSLRLLHRTRRRRRRRCCRRRCRHRRCCRCCCRCRRCRLKLELKTYSKKIELRQKAGVASESKF